MGQPCTETIHLIDNDFNTICLYINIAFDLNDFTFTQGFYIKDEYSRDILKMKAD